MKIGALRALFSSSLIVALASACSKTGTSASDGSVAASSTVDAGARDAGEEEARGVVQVEAAAPDEKGTWQREPEPYKGMRIRIEEGAAVVVDAPPITDERLAARGKTRDARLAAAELECQRRSWKKDDAYLRGIHRDASGELRATVLVRDWGIVGSCRHVDAWVPANLRLASTDTLIIDVVRNGKTTPQEWHRVD